MYYADVAAARIYRLRLTDADPNAPPKHEVIMKVRSRPAPPARCTPARLRSTT